MKDGLPSNEVYDVLQDHNGFIWFATENGVAQFDGTQFTSLTMRNGLPDNMIYKIYEDTNGRIWFLPLNGLPVYYKDFAIQQLMVKDVKLSKSLIVRSVNEKNGRVIFAAGAGFLTIDTNGKVTASGYSNQNTNELREAIAYDPVDDSYWNRIVNTQGQPVCVEVIVQGQTKRFPLTDFDPLMFNEYFPDRVSLNDYYRLQNGKIQLRSAKALSMLKNASKCSAGMDFRLFMCQPDKCWLSIGSQGVMPFENQQKDYPGFIKGISNCKVSDCLIDKENNVWFTTIGKGVYLQNSASLMSRLIHDELPDPLITALFGQGDSLWLGFQQGKVVLYELEKQKFTTFDLGVDNQLTAIQPMHELVFFGLSKGIVYLKNGKFKALVDRRNRRDFAAVKCFYPMNDSTLFVGTHRSLLNIDQKCRFEDVLHIPNDSINRCYSIARVHNQLWVGSGSGLKRFQDAHLVSLDLNTHQIDVRINGIVELASDWVAVATQGYGVFLIKDKRVVQIREEQGLVGDICNAIIKDSQEQNVLWISTTQGISRLCIQDFNKLRFTLNNITEMHGLSSNDVRGIYTYKDSVYAATARGLSVFVRNPEAGKPIDVPVFLTNVAIAGRDTAWTQGMDLDPEDNAIDISFVGLSYRSHGNVQYKYRMLGLDSTWYFTNHTGITYPLLPLGTDLVFEVYAKGIDGCWSNKPARLAFSVGMPLLYTNWFRLVLVLVFFVGFAIFIRSRFQLVRLREQEKTNLNKKIAEVEMKALRAQMNPHFTFNALNSIQHLIMQQDMDAAQKYLAQFSKLLRNVLENSRLSNIRLDAELNSIRIYLSLEQLRFGNNFEFELHVDESIEPAEIMIPSMLIQPFLENAIWHGLILKEGCRKVSLRIHMEEDYLICMIEDNGIGRDAASAAKTWKEAHKSMGMEVTEERLQVLNATKSKEASFKVIDLLDEEGDAAGTRIELKIPYEEDFN